ncbi:hypothetical protein MAR_021698 [Mya arenaria]|uniref:Uncharacterized protein n=1 Tax=Mya arenaria TaxID=6604 RepID=A0ABY7EAY1_MYAAR|nr:hypothetical protein MAR_021698 [Mya arenaria]
MALYLKSLTLLRLESESHPAWDTDTQSESILLSDTENLCQSRASIIICDTFYLAITFVDIFGDSYVSNVGSFWPFVLRSRLDPEDEILRDATANALPMKQSGSAPNDQSSSACARILMAYIMLYGFSCQSNPGQFSVQAVTFSHSYDVKIPDSNHNHDGLVCQCNLQVKVTNRGKKKRWSHSEQTMLQE